MTAALTAAKSSASRFATEVSIEDGAAILGIKRGTMVNLVGSRRIKSRKLHPSCQVVVEYSSLIEYFDERENAKQRTAEQNRASLQDVKLRVDVAQPKVRTR